MIYFYFIPILIAFLGGFLGRVLAFRKVHHRILAFLVPVTVCALLMHIPLLIEITHGSGFHLDWGTLRELGISQGLILLTSFLATGIGWLCSFCIENG
jgi:hypothetical protein